MLTFGAGMVWLLDRGPEWAQFAFIGFLPLNLPALALLGAVTGGFEFLSGTPLHPYATALVFWLSWYGVVFFLQRRARLKAPLTLLSSPVKTTP